MVYLINSDHFSEDELGMMIYRALSISIEAPEPWWQLSDDEKQYYKAAAWDFVRLLRREEGKLRTSVRRKLWYFDFTTSKAISRWMRCDDPAHPEQWSVGEGKAIKRFVLGEDAFQYQDEALAHGRDTLLAYNDSVRDIVARLNDEIQRSLSERETNERDSEPEMAS